MTREEFNNLKIGDVCRLRQGYSRGMRGTVVYIEQIGGIGYVLLRALDEFSTRGSCTNRHFRLTNYHDLIIDK